MKIGVLALQGAFAEHIATLEKLKTEAIPVRLPHQLVQLSQQGPGFLVLCQR